MKVLNPYLNFNGNCKEAFDFYKSVFGGEFTMMQKFSDIPDTSEVAEEDMDKTMHVSLPISENSILMGSDMPASMGEARFGNGLSISINVDDNAEAGEIFEKISEGGKITMPFEKQFWNSFYGMCIDKFGVHWMVDSEIKE